MFPASKVDEWVYLVYYRCVTPDNISTQTETSMAIRRVLTPSVKPNFRMLSDSQCRGLDVGDGVYLGISDQFRIMSNESEDRFMSEEIVLWDSATTWHTRG